MVARFNCIIFIKWLDLCHTINNNNLTGKCFLSTGILHKNIILPFLVVLTEKEVPLLWFQQQEWLPNQLFHLIRIQHVYRWGLNPLIWQRTLFCEQCSIVLSGAKRNLVGSSYVPKTSCNSISVQDLLAIIILPNKVQINFYFLRQSFSYIQLSFFPGCPKIYLTLDALYLWLSLAACKCLLLQAQVQLFCWQYWKGPHFLPEMGCHNNALPR